MADWRANILEDPAKIRDLLRETRRIAVLGIKTEAAADQPAHYVAKYLATQKGIEVIPVPVYYPDAQEILGKKVYRRLVDVFRRPADVTGHLEDLRAKRPRAVWLQLGIRNDAAAEVLAKDGILVVQDRCLMVEWRRLAG